MPVDDPGGGYDPAAASHRALREIRRELERHPVVLEARGFPTHPHTHIEADVDPARLGSAAEDATLTVRWFAGAAPDDPPEFSFHYSDDAGTDVGWHHEPNPHVEGWGHSQARSRASDDYTYEPCAFATLVPPRVVWEVTAALEDALPLD